jgi:hypothetical protein
MKRITALLALVAMVFVTTGCAASAVVSASKLNVGVNTRAHALEEPHFTTGPGEVEIGLGVVTVGGKVGLGDHPDGQWVSAGVAVGPK